MVPGYFHLLASLKVRRHIGACLSSCGCVHDLNKQSILAHRAGCSGSTVRDFGHALAPNFTTGLFSPKNLKPLAIGSMATLAFLPLDQKIGDSTRGHFVEFGKSGSISSHHY
jgi:hypothetical protein